MDKANTRKQEPEDSEALGPAMPPGTALGDSFEVGKYLGSSNHGHTYSIIARSQAWKDILATHKVEARLYDFNSIPLRYKPYRHRSLKRMRSSGRFLIETTWRGCPVVVFKADDAKPESNRSELGPSNMGRKTDADDSSAAKESPQSSPTSSKSTKTIYQRESARLRQRDRRCRKRELGKHSDGVSPTISESVDVDEKTYFAYVLWDIAFNKGPDAHKRLSGKLQDVVEEYLRRQTEKIDFSASKDLEQFAQIKEMELVQLRRHLSRLPAYKKYTHSHLGKLLREQAVQKKGSQEWSNQQTNVNTAKYKYRVLLGVDKKLPELISEAKTMLKTLKQNLSRMRAEESESASREALRNKAKELSEEATKLRTWAYRVLPGSEMYYMLESQHRAVVEEQGKTSVDREDDGNEVNRK